MEHRGRLSEEEEGRAVWQSSPRPNKHCVPVSFAPATVTALNVAQSFFFFFKCNLVASSPCPNPLPLLRIGSEFSSLSLRVA